MATTKTIKSRRTTVTLEGDVSQELADRLRKNPGLKEKVLINELLRKGLKEESASPEKVFTIKPIKANLQPGINLNNIEALLEEIE